MAIPITPNGTGLGDMLDRQVVDETEEERKKRLREQQQALVGPTPLSSAMGLTRSGALSSVYGGAY
jgi:hypothetical protein